MVVVKKEVTGLMKGTIQEGDIVQVDMHQSEYTLCRNAIVIYKPVATGDSWVFEARDTGYTYHVSEGCTVSRKNI